MSGDISKRVIGASTAFAARFDKGVEIGATDYRKVATVVPSTSSSTGYGFLSRYPKVREWIGDRELVRLKDHDYILKNRLFESTIIVPRTDFEDNDYGKYAPLMEDMGREAAEFPNEHVFGLLANGFAECGFDDVPFFSSDHPVETRQGTEKQSNYLTDSNKGEPWFLLDASRALKPLIWQERTKPELQTVAESEDSRVFLYDEFLYGIRARGNAGFAFWQLAAASDQTLDANNFNALYKMMTARKDWEGRPMHIQPKLLVVPPSLRQQAHDVVMREYLAGGESNINYKIVDIYVCPYL